MKKSDLYIIIGAGVTVFCTVAFFAWTYVPYLQMRNYYRHEASFEQGDATALTPASFAFVPYSYVQPELRNDLLYRLFALDLDNRDATVAPLLPFAIKEMEAVVARKADFPKYLVSLARAHTLLAKLNVDPKSNLVLAEGYYVRALALRPRSQEILYPYSINLSNQGKFAEAVALLEDAQRTTPTDRTVDYYLGIALYRFGPGHFDEALSHLEVGIGSGATVDQQLLHDIYQRFFAYYYAKRDMLRFLTVVQRLQKIDTANGALYQQIEQYVQAHGNIPAINIQ